MGVGCGVTNLTRGVTFGDPYNCLFSTFSFSRFSMLFNFIIQLTFWKSGPGLLSCQTFLLFLFACACSCLHKIPQGFLHNTDACHTFIELGLYIYINCLCLTNQTSHQPGEKWPW
jgi:hypothetical protein